MTTPDRDGRAGGFFAPYVIPQSAERPDGKGCTRPGCIDAHVAPEPAEVAVEVEDREFLWSLLGAPPTSYETAFFRKHVAALTAKAKAEGAREALWEAAERSVRWDDEIDENDAAGLYMQIRFGGDTGQPEDWAEAYRVARLDKRGDRSKR